MWSSLPPDVRGRPLTLASLPLAGQAGLPLGTDGHTLTPGLRGVWGAGVRKGAPRDPRRGRENPEQTPQIPSWTVPESLAG